MRAASAVLAVFAAVAALATAGPVAAQPYRMPVSPKKPEHTLSLTLSPLHLLFPLAEATAEYRGGPRLGLAAIGGVGSISVDVGSDKSRFFALELGGSVRYYALGSFQGGLQVGAEVLYVYLAVDDTTSSVSATGASDGLSLGPFVGYKWIGRSGFTFDGQAGLAIAAYRAHASDGGSAASASDSSLYPLLNVNVGWSM